MRNNNGCILFNISPIYGPVTFLFIYWWGFHETYRHADFIAFFIWLKRVSGFIYIISCYMKCVIINEQTLNVLLPLSLWTVPDDLLIAWVFILTFWLNRPAFSSVKFTSTKDICRIWIWRGEALRHSVRMLHCFLAQWFLLLSLSVWVMMATVSL